MSKKTFAKIFSFLSIASLTYSFFKYRHNEWIINSNILLASIIIAILITIVMHISFKYDKRSTLVGVLVLLFVNIIAGILYLTWKPKKIYDYIGDDKKLEAYNKAKKLMENDDWDSLNLAIKLLDPLGYFLDSRALIRNCRERMNAYCVDRKSIAQGIFSLIAGIIIITIAVIIVGTNTKYRVVYETAGGSKIETIRYKSGENISLPLEPTKEGYVFAGWDQELPEKMPSRKLVLTASWVKYGEVFIQNDIKYIYFGEYAKEKVTDQDTIYNLNNQEVIEYKKESIIEFNGKRYKDFADCYYNISPIKWQVIEENSDRYKLISDCIITTFEEATEPISYLNDEFINCYFKEEEINRIIADANNNKVQMIDYEYYYDEYCHPKNLSLRYARITDYAKMRGADWHGEYASWYLGYTKRVNDGSYVVIGFDGWYFPYKRMERWFGIRPVIEIAK